MTRNRLILLFAAMALILSSLACGFSVSTANIKNAALASDPDGENLTEVFSPQQPFYLVVDLANAPDDTVLKAVWIAADVEEVEPGFIIDEVEISTGLPEVYFDLSNDNLWPSGSYQVDLYLNGELDRTLDFEVR